MSGRKSTVWEVGSKLAAPVAVVTVDDAGRVWIDLARARFSLKDADDLVMTLIDATDCARALDGGGK